MRRRAEEGDSSSWVFELIDKAILPESFEWLVLWSGLSPDAEVQKMLRNPAEYIEYSRFFSWEQLFAAELVECSKDSHLAYSK